MSRPARAVILDYFRAVDACDIAAVLSSFAPDSEYERPGYPAIHGHDELRRFYEHDRVIASGQHVIERVVVEGDTGACWGRFTGRLRDGAAVDVRFADVYTFEAGKIKTRRTHFYAPVV